MAKLIRRLLFGIITAIALYSWAGFLLIPSIALSVINQQLEQYSSQPARLQRLEFNPFSLKLDLWQLHIGEEKTTAAFEHLDAQLAWDSLWTSRIHLKSASLARPHIWLDIDSGGVLNLTELFLLPEKNDTAKEPEDAPAVVVQVDHILLENGQLHFSDQRPRQPVAVEFNELDVELNNLSTAADEQGQLQLKLQASDGATLAWQGDISLQPLGSSGSLSIDNIALSSWWAYVAEQTQLDLNSGKLSLSADYQLSAVPDWQFIGRNLALHLQQLDLASQQQPLLQLDRLSITNTSADLQQQSLHIGLIDSHKLASRVHIDSKGQLNWLQAINPAASQSAPAENTNDSSPETTEQNETASTTRENALPGTILAQLPWHIRLDKLQLNDYGLAFNDNSKADPVSLQIHELNLGINNFDSRKDDPVGLTLSSRIGEQGQLSLDAQIRPHSLQSQLQLHSSNLDLRPAQAWISPFVRIELASALLDTELTAELQQIEPLLASASGVVNISQLHVRDRQDSRDLLKWDTLALQDLSFKQGEHSQLDIGRIITRQPYVRLIIDEQLQTNISKIIIDQPDNNKPGDTAGTSEFRFRLGEILIEDGSAHFADFSLKPHFATVIQDLKGRIGTLDSQKNLSTPVDISGAVDRYAPVSIKGSLTPFDPLHQLDINTSFRQIELTTLTPYSGKFAGYRIHKGRLNLGLNYQIDQGKLNAHNEVLLEQLQLGDAVDSPDAVKLPVRLAVALLKDNKGNIDIKLPVSGDLNDPQFSVMPVVWQTLRNLITRAVSAPFKMLGSLAGSSQDLGQVGFSAGQHELTVQGQQSLTSLAQALQQRPELKLNIEGTSSSDFDGPSTAKRYIHYRVQQLWYAELQNRGRKIDGPPEELEVPERQYRNLLEQLYKELPAQERAPEELKGSRNERMEQMHQYLVTHHTSNPILLRTLAQDRARSIRQYLVEQGGISSERLFLVDVNEQASASDNAINSLLHLDVLSTTRP